MHRRKMNSTTTKTKTTIQIYKYHCIVVLSVRNHVPVVAWDTGWSCPIAFKRGFAENFFGCMASWHQMFGWDGRVTIWDVTTFALCRVASAFSSDKFRKLTFWALNFKKKCFQRIRFSYAVYQLAWNRIQLILVIRRDFQLNRYPRRDRRIDRCTTEAFLVAD